MALDLLTRWFFTDSGLSAGLAKANAQLTAIGRSGPGASAGLRAVQTGMRQLAFSAAGLTGPLGSVARGLLQIGGGNALMLGAVAGLGVLATAYDLTTKSTRDAIKEQEDFIAVLRQVGPHATAAAERIKLAMLRGQAGQRQSLKEVGEQFLADMTGGLLGRSREEQKQALQRLIATQTIAVVKAEDSATDAAKKHADQIARAADEARRLKLEAIEFLQATIQLEKGGVFRALPIRFAAPAFGTSGTPQLGGPATFQNIRRNEPRFVPGEAPKPDRISAMEIAQLSQATMLMLMARGGGPGGAFSALGGFAGGLAGMGGIGAAAGPLAWAGFGLSAIGGFVSLFDKSEERRQREVVEELRRIRENTERRGQPDRSSITILLNGKELSGALVDDVLYAIRRQERLDATPRLPPR